MSKEEKFKKTLQQLLEEQQFAFEESDWAAAKKVIDDKRRKRRLLPIWLVFIGLLIGGGTVLLWTDEQPDLLSVDKCETASVPAFIPTPEKIQGEKILFESNPSPSTSAKQASGSSPNHPPLAQEVIRPVTEHQPTATEPSNETHKVTETEANPQQLSTSATNEHDPTTNTNLAAPQAAAPGNTAPEPNKVLPAQQTTEGPLVAALPVTSLNETPTVAPTEQPSLAVTATVSEAPQQKDSSATSAEPIAALSLPEANTNMLWSVEAGLTALYGWNASEGREGRGLNPVLGINYHNAITNQFAYAIGLHFTSIAHLGAFSDTSKVTSYSFGEESQVTVIRPQSFYYLQVPLRFTWNFSKKQFLGSSFELGYLLNVKSRVETYETSYTMSEKQSSTAYGYTEGVAPFNFQIGFFYRRELFNNLYIQPEVFFGLVDLKDDVVFKSSTKERSSGLKLSLLYSIKNR